MATPLHRRVVPETYVQLLYEYLAGQGHSPEAILGAPWPVPDPTCATGVDVKVWAGMLETAEAQLGDPLIALHVGQSINPRHLGIVGPVIASCGTLGVALQKLERYQRLVSDFSQMTPRAGAQWMDLVWDSRPELNPGRLVNETGFVVLIQFARSLARGAVNPMVVEFAHAGPADTRPFENYFGCPVRFDRPDSLIRIGLDVLATPLKSPDPVLMQVLEQHAERMLEQLPQQEEIVEKLRKKISQALREGEPDIERISEALACSSRTLRRRLQAAGTGFREELNLVRHELALSYLRDPRLQIVDIALLLGYSEHSAFTRAFREHSGITPQQMRQTIGRAS